MNRALSHEDLEHVLTHTRDVWRGARGARVFLTGGTGFFGVWLAETFAHANARLGLGASLTILSRDPRGAVARAPRLGELPGVEFVRGDVRSFELPDREFTHVIHGAAESSQQGHVGDHRHMFDTIVDGTRRTLDLARHAAASNYLLISSGAVYGTQPPNLSHVPETFTGGPVLTASASAYGEGKRAAEVLAAVEAERSGLSVRVARCFAFVGPFLPLDIHFAIGNFLRDVMGGGPIRIRGDGTAVRSYLYMADLAVWLWTLALGAGSVGAYNVGSEEALTIADTARGVAAIAREPIEIVVERRADPGVAANRYVPSTDKARAQLGLAQHITLPEAIRRTARWHGFDA